MYNKTSEEIGHLADICNQKKKAAKIAGVRKRFAHFLTILILHVYRF